MFKLKMLNLEMKCKNTMFLFPTLWMKVIRFGKRLHLKPQNKKEAQRAAAGKALLGALIVAAAASSASDSDYYDYNVGATVAATVGAGLLVSAVGDAQEAKVHESTINEVSKSFDGEIAPQVIEMEGLQVKLEGNIQNQFDQWQTILADIYKSESNQTNEFEIL